MATSQNRDGVAQKQPSPDLDPDLPDEDEQDYRIYGARLSLGQMGVQGMVVKLPPAQRKALGYPETGPVPMADIYGIVRSLTDPKKLPMKDGETEQRYCRGLVGKLEGRNLATGEFFSGGAGYLPSGFHDECVSDVEHKLAQAGPGGEVRIGWRFVCVQDGNLSGFTWKAISLVPVDKNDPVIPMRTKSLKLSTDATMKALSALSAPKIEDPAAVA